MWNQIKEGVRTPSAPINEEEEIDRDNRTKDE